ncbi:hypothetical protein Nm8I071_63110 [Nonomuraea sp. TT08I-71]|nr:hypothetical protein Nm8I071_63110 [Nonomuraea sp. TT08I-71]
MHEPDPPTRQLHRPDRASAADRNPGSIQDLGEDDKWGYEMTNLGKRAVQVVEELTTTLSRLDDGHQGEAESEPTMIDVEIVRVLASEPFELSSAAEKVVARAYQN